jgi:hypothetical protein
MASGFSLSDMGTELGCCLKAGVGGACGGATRGRASGKLAGRASCAAWTVGVIGDTGGRLGDCERDCERRWVRWSDGGVDAALGEVDGVLVSTRSAGMAEVGREAAGGGWTATCVRCGGARGVETLAEGQEKLASQCGLRASRPARARFLPGLPRAVSAATFVLDYCYGRRKKRHPA